MSPSTDSAGELPPLALDEPYRRRFASQDVLDATRTLINQGFVFVLLKDGGKVPKGWWKTRDKHGEKTEKVVRRSPAECVSHLAKDDGNSIGIVPDGAGVLILDCDNYRNGWEKRPFKLFAKLFGEQVGEVLVLPSRRPCELPKMHIFYRCDVAYANRKFGRTKNGRTKVRTQKTKKKRYHGEAIGRHYVKVHHPELLPVLAKWRASGPEKIKRKTLPKVLDKDTGSSPAMKLPLKTVEALKAENDEAQRDIEEFRPPATKWSEGRHFWVNGNAISGAMQGFGEEQLRAHLWAQVPKVRKHKVLDKDEFDRFFDLGYEYGLGKVERRKLVRKGAEAGGEYDWGKAERAERKAIERGMDADEVREALQEGLERGLANRALKNGFRF